MGDWGKVEKLSRHICTQSYWSKAMFSYFSGCALLMVEEPTLNHMRRDRKEGFESVVLSEQVLDDFRCGFEVFCEGFRNVEKYKRKVLNKHIPDESYANLRACETMRTGITVIPFYVRAFVEFLSL